MLSNQKMSTELPLLGTKISVPPIPPEFVRRPRLTDRINRGVKGPLTLLSAPAGFGKTNLLVEWTAETSLSVAWLTLNDEDNDLSRFFRYLISALQGVESGLGEDVLDFIQSTKSSGLEMGLTLLINEISALPKDIALVLDDFQVLEAPAIHQSLSFLLKHLPHNLHLVIASRSEMALDLAFLRAKGWVVELGADELRFTSEEVALFFKQTMGLRLPPETVRALEERTEGWITALQLAAISLRSQSSPLTMLAGFHGDAHYLVDFLAEEVLYRQPEEVRQFLLRCSILDILSGPLCEAVVNPDSQPGYGANMLDRLEHANLFVTPLDQSHEWFRFHQMFADFLRHIQGETQAAEVPCLHRRAAAWFEQHGNLDEACKHALAAGDAEWAADLIERNIGASIKAGELLALTRWIGKLPDKVIQRRPRLSLPYAWGLIVAYQLDKARFWLDRVERTPIDRQPDEEASVGPRRSTNLWNIQGGLAICRSMLALISGNVQQAAEFSRAAMDSLHEDSPFIRSTVALEDSLYFILSGDTSKAIETLRETARIARGANNVLVLVVATCELAGMQAMQGHLSQALVTLQKAQFMALGPDGNPLPLAGIVDVEFGEILRERDLLQKAKDYLERGRQLTHDWWSLSSLEGLISLARVLQSRGDIAGAQALIDEASSLALSTESSQWDDMFVSAVAARLALQRNDLTAAAQWLKKSGLLDAAGSVQALPHHVHEYMQLTQARYYLATGQDRGDARRLRQALEILQSILPEVEQFQRVTSKIEILVLQALTDYALGETNQAVNALLSALALGEPEDYRRIFLDEGRPLAELLACCRQAQKESGDYLPSLGYIESLLETIRPAGGAAQALPPVGEKQPEPTTTRTEDGFPISLSAREVEVLSLIAAGKSNQEISSQLFLALNTVKRHAYNIYAKLEVKKRTQAVSKARQLGLIP